MNCSRCQCDAGDDREVAIDSCHVKRWVAEVDGIACGIADAGMVADADIEQFDRWIGHGMHGEMGYMERYRELRCDPRLLLEGAQSLVVVAFAYFHGDQTEGNLAAIASYAHGDDYHEVVRERLERVAQRIRTTYGGATRVCVDTAPLFERYWAVRAGVGFIGRNRMLIVPGSGSYVFIGEILTTVKLQADAPNEGHCDGCGKCVASCPGGALTADGIDARKCLSYLTIEHRGEFDEDVDLCGWLYGCDACQRVCPHNNGLNDTAIAEFKAREALRGLTPERVDAMQQEEWSAVMRRSAIKRAKLAGLQRNARQLRK